MIESAELMSSSRFESNGSEEEIELEVTNEKRGSRECVHYSTGDEILI